MSGRDTLRPASVYERPLSAEEVARWLGRPIAADEIESVADLVRWFTTRYPTAGERLAYARRAYARWMRSAKLRRS